MGLLLGDAPPGLTQLRGLMAVPWQWPLAIFISFMSGPWSEEFGWRGYALEPSLRRWGLWGGSILLGILWGIWHLPLFFMPDTWHGQVGPGFSGLGMFVLLSIGNTLLMTVVYRNTNRSILSGMLMHFVGNFSSQLVAPLTLQGDVFHMGLVFVAGVAVMAWFMRRPAEKPAPAAG